MSIPVVKTKEFVLKIKALTEAGTFEGYASVFGVRDSFNEIVDPPAFNESMARHRREGTWPLMLWQHRPDEPIGVWEDIATDGKGLYVKGRLLIDQNVPAADKVYSLLKASAVRGMSIGYRVMPGGIEEDEKSPGIFHLTKLDLLEVSIVSFPANRRAQVDAVKSGDEHAIIWWEKLQALARKGRDGDPGAIKEFEEVLREAGFPRRMATDIASVGYAKAVRREVEGDEAVHTFVERMTAAAGAFLNSR